MPFFFTLLFKLGGYILAAGLQVLCFMLADQSSANLLLMIILFGLLCNAITVARSQCAAEYFEEYKLKIEKKEEKS